MGRPPFMPTANTNCHWRTAGVSTGPSDGRRPRPHRPIGRPRCPCEHNRPSDWSRPSDRTAKTGRGRPRSDGLGRALTTPTGRPPPSANRGRSNGHPCPRPRSDVLHCPRPTSIRRPPPSASDPIRTASALFSSASSTPPPLTLSHGLHF
jgi:hypothetical protein